MCMFVSVPMYALRGQKMVPETLVLKFQASCEPSHLGSWELNTGLCKISWAVCLSLFGTLSYCLCKRSGFFFLSSLWSHKFAIKEMSFTWNSECGVGKGSSSVSGNRLTVRALALHLSHYCQLANALTLSMCCCLGLSEFLLFRCVPLDRLLSPWVVSSWKDPGNHIIYFFHVSHS